MNLKNSAKLLRLPFIKLMVISIFLMSFQQALSQNDDNINSRDILYLTTGGKLQPLQAIMDIRHYSISLEVDIAKQSISGTTEVKIGRAHV